MKEYLDKRILHIILQELKYKEILIIANDLAEKDVERALDKNKKLNMKKQEHIFTNRFNHYRKTLIEHEDKV